MQRSLTVQCVTLTAALFFTFSFFIGCSSGEKLPNQISGKWQRAEGEGNVEINLVAEPKILKFDGQSYTATIEKVDTGANSVHLKVETKPGQSEDWTIHQIWDDNGTSFSLVVYHNGTQEKLVNGKHS